MNDVNKATVAEKTDTSAVAVFTYLRGLWQEMLRVPQVNPEDNFFTLGGDSMLVIEMLVAVSAHFDKEFEYNKFFPKPNVATLSAIVQEQLRAS
jgi:yersiniabactin nonribosomal peptide synthetase